MKVVVIGAGVFGTWTALSLAKAGHQVILLDQVGPGNPLSSSAGESRIIRSAYGADEVYTVMAQRSLRLWTNLFDGADQRDCYRETGVLWIAPSEEASIWQARATFQRLGVAHEWLDAHEIRNRYGQFKVSDNAVALWEPEAGALLARRSIAAVMTEATSVGVSYETAQVLPPVLGGPRLESIRTTDGRRLQADCFVFACGSWLPKLFAALAGLIYCTRQELFYLSSPEGSVEFAEGALPIWIDQMDSRMAYGFPDFGNGVKLGFHRLGPALDPDTPRIPPGAEAINEAGGYLAQRFPRMKGASMRATEVCHYENTPNGDFLIDLQPGMENVWLVGGGSGHGFKHGPAVGEYLLGMLEGKRQPEGRFLLATKISATGRVL